MMPDCWPNSASQPFLLDTYQSNVIQYGSIAVGVKKIKKKVLFVLLPVTILVLGLFVLYSPLTETPNPHNQQPSLSVNEDPPVTVTSTEPEAATEPASAFGTLAFEHLRALEIIGPRVAGTTQEQQAAEYISSVFKEIGYAPSTQQFPAWDEDGVSYQSANIISTKAGNSTVEIIVGAHYDSVDVGRGVDDNASGVGVMLEVAELVFSLETPYTIRFIAFGSEENDLDGSYYFVDQLSPAELKNIIAMVNLDSLVAGDVAYVYSDEGPNAFLRDWVLDWSAEYNFPLKTIRNVDLSDDGWPTADYGPFQEEGIAFAYFEATNWALGDRDGYTQVDPKYGEDGHIWHTKYDNSNYLEKTFPGRISMRLAGFSAALYAICTEFTR
jgi:alkaline phosphatase isozyme conversion protein